MYIDEDKDEITVSQDKDLFVAYNNARGKLKLIIKEVKQVED